MGAITQQLRKRLNGNGDPYLAAAYVRNIVYSLVYYILYYCMVSQSIMTLSIASNDHPALYPHHEKPALVEFPESSIPGSDHGSQENKLEKGAFYDSAASDTIPTLSGADEKKLLRRIDWRLLPLLAAMYVIKTIDAQNVSHRAYHWHTSETYLTCRRSPMRAQWTKALSTTS
jgi:hypothetical protein